MLFRNTYFCEQFPALLKQNEHPKVTVNRYTLAT